VLLLFNVVETFQVSIAIASPGTMSLQPNRVAIVTGASVSTILLITNYTLELTRYSPEWVKHYPGTLFNKAGK
jgi:hypothetical protein